ncbi:methyl-accepting chemotaxis protein [Clostridium sp. CX1]|uniref:methyl-accepting chemotaxis protein n=1 Tax=Clostridium sp. CX1 TaxID=2978346 RepID=UPI0021BED6C3|nr:methyl-accepting chemotaxis protein [Clostridium sp. CX1]MCT8976573.1 methyl-accepting chemotaxis protein [Clostridium sp. CX1]
MKKIRSKIILGILVCTFIMALLIGVTSINEASRAIDKEARDKLLSITESKSKDFSAMFKDIEKTVDFVSNTVLSDFDLEKAKSDPAYLQEYENKIEPLIRKLGETTDGAMGSYIYFNPELVNVLNYVSYDDTDKDKKFTRKTSYTIDNFKKDNKDMDWFYGPVKKGAGTWSDIYVDMHSKVEMISYGKPILINNTLVAVAGMDVDFNLFRNAINKIKLYDSGYSYLVSAEGNMLVHPKYKRENTIFSVENGTFKNVWDEFKKNKSGVTEYNYNGKKMTGYYTMPNGYILSTSVPYNEVLASINKLELLIPIIVVAGMIIAVIVAVLIANKISKPLMEAIRLLNKISKLDLTYDISYEKLATNKDEIGIMAHALGAMRESLQTMVGSIKGGSRNTATSAEELSIISKENANSIDAAAKATSEIAQGSTELVKNVEVGVEKLDYLAKQINNSVTNSNLIRTNMDKTSKVNAEGIEYVNKLETAVKENVQVIEKVTYQVSELNNKSELIGKITDTIKSITDQINLLSLNAAIEAARAGEQGKGFAVVADEIRKLASETATSTKEIENIVRDFKSNIEDTKQQVGEAKTVIDKTNEVSKNTKKAFSAIDKSVSNVIKQVDMLIENINSIGENKNEVVNSVDSISAISQETAATIEEISASVQEQSASMELLFKSTNELSNIAMDLEKQVDKFII